MLDWYNRRRYQGHVSTGSLSNLVELVIEDMTGFRRLCNGPFPKGFLRNLKILRVNNCHQMQEVIQTEEQLREDQKRLWKGPRRHYVGLRSLKVVEISYCNRLKYLFSACLAQSLVMLEQLKILHCDSLEHIFATELETDYDNIESDPPLLFPKLISLYIRNCPRLEYVFRIPLPRGLPNLLSVFIADSPRLKQVFNVAKEMTTGVDEGIALPCLQNLRLENLMNLSCFCSKNYPIIISPSLQSLNVWNCPALSNFTMRHQINKTIDWEKIIQIQTSRLEVINLIGIHEFGPMQVAGLQFLRELEVSKINRVKSLFPYSLARNLPQLKFLRVSRCEELEEIIKMDQTSIALSSSSSSEGHLQHVSFPELKLLELSKLPCLKSFGPMGYHFQFGSLIRLDVEECPNLLTSFSKDSKHTVHATSVVPNQLFF